MAGNVDGPIWIVSQNDPLLADLERYLATHFYFCSMAAMELGIPKMMGHPLKKQTVRLLEGNQSWENDVYLFFISWFAMWFPKLSK
jgi:hypothetical protein